MMDFAFQWPWLLLALLVVLPLSQLFAYARHQRAAVAKQLGGQVDDQRRAKDMLRLSGIALILLALARPGIDPQRVSVTNVGRDVVFVLDVSQSMLARDAAPSRLEVAKQGIRDALKTLRSSRAALIIYAGNANILCPLTHDYDFVSYMLDQATTRSVEFGGTQFISAVEKAVGQVFSEGRAGLQDLVLLTDGEDHAADHPAIAEQLTESDAGLLIIGIGDADRGSRIPIENDDGQIEWLQYQDQPVESKLNSTSLRELADIYPNSQYIEAGTTPFDLAAHYREFIKTRPVGGSDDVGDTIVVYREIGFIFATLGLVLFLLAECNLQRLKQRLRPVTVSAAALLLTNQAWGSDSHFISEFEQAHEFQTNGNYSEALDRYLVLRSEYRDADSSALAVIHFNAALCKIHSATKQQESSPRTALIDAQLAQDWLLTAKQLAPDLTRAGQRLDSVSTLIKACLKQIEQEEEEQDALQDRILALLTALQLLVQEQGVLLEEIPRPVRKKGKPQLPATPDTAASWLPRQQGLTAKGQEIADKLSALDKELSISIPGMIETDSVFKVPAELMMRAVTGQTSAEGYVQLPKDWPLARRELTIAIQKMNEILQMLSGQSDQSEEGEWDEDYDDEDWDLEDYDEASESQSTSMQAAGNLAQSSDMQPLPKPNYSAQDILAEEFENQQFRERKRAASQAAGVEKSW